MTERIDPGLTKATNLLVESIIDAKSKWIGALFKAILPEQVYAWSQSQNNQDRIKLARWLSKQGISTKEGDGFTHVLFNDRVIGEWRYRLENKRVEQTCRMIGPLQAAEIKSSLQISI